MGRSKKTNVWKCFKTLDGGSITCIYCKKIYKFANICKMKRHIEICSKAPDTAKKDVSENSNVLSIASIELSSNIIPSSSSDNVTILKKPMKNNQISNFLDSMNAEENVSMKFIFIFDRKRKKKI